MPILTSLVEVRLHFPVWLLAVLLGLITIALYWPVTSHDFINYDDQAYVTENVHVQAGLTLENLKWVFISPVDGNWHPITILSHMLDCQLFGLNPWGHHLTSVLLHAVNTVLVFLLLRSLTGAVWRSVLVAALFGWHPVHVESVAWVAERKDVLSTCLGLLALIFYARYARKQSGVVTQPAPLDYVLALLFLILGLMSKPMLVTWPFVMLLLDYWPLGRLKAGSLWQLVREKIPFFTLAVMASGVTFAVQKHGGAVIMLKNLPFSARGANALVSYCRYLGKLFWPTKLAVFYPRPGHWPLAEVLLAGGLLVGLSVLFWWQRRRHPFLLMGWLWFLGTLVPVIGLVQVGKQALADRYAYIPSLGVLIMAIWGAYEFSRHWRYHVIGLSMAGSAVMVLCMVLTLQQLAYWQDDETLFRHALAVTEDNYIAHDGLGDALEKEGHVTEAIQQFEEALRLEPDLFYARNSLGDVFEKEGFIDEAIQQFEEALRLEPDFVSAHNNLGAALEKEGRIDDAIRQFQEAIRLEPDCVEARYNLGTALGKEGQNDEAIRQFQEAIRLKPDYADAHYNLGNDFFKKGQSDEAIQQFQEAICLEPDHADAHFNLGAAFFMSGQSDEAIQQFQEAIRLEPDFASAHCYLGDALEKEGQIDGAIQQFQEAIQLKPDYADARNSLANALEMKKTPLGR
jgi:tetratricopeptide (TPR) repeat protein